MAHFFDTSIDYIVGNTDIRRKIEKTSLFSLNEDESALIERYRALTEREKECIRVMKAALTERQILFNFTY